ncbi:MAG TPA: heparan-alpha-glucosaminide N-acetyltransferase domain-containing protein, partial [Puia sp.]|nr:heparan-alpha-glucosaminide N-acetyltransferase domain-containing protein [Puia sp.]
MKRLSSIDIVRGLVMVIMALDHTRDLLHAQSLTQSPTNLATTTPILFFTRWITHLCAPTFVFLAGTSAWLALEAGSDKKAGRRFLLTRGLALIAIEMTLVNFGLNFDLKFRIFFFEVIATIGAGFVILSFLSRLSWGAIATIGAIIFFGHDLLTRIPLPGSGAPRFIATLFLSLDV